MNRRTIIIIISIVLVASLGIGVTLFLTNANNKKKEEASENNWQKAAEDYFKDTSKTETSIEALIENGYLEDKDVKSKNKDMIIVKNESNEIVESGSDIQKAKELSKEPVIVINASDDFKINEWNNKGTYLTFSLKNGGNSYYKESDITKISWANKNNGSLYETDKIKIADQNINNKYTLFIEFKDGELYLEKDFNIMVDVDNPTLVEKNIVGNGVFVTYEDQSDIKDVFYGATLGNVKPNKSEMSKEKPYFECNKKYYVWSYATDYAGNSSSIELIGEHTRKCTEISN